MIDKFEDWYIEVSFYFANILFLLMALGLIILIADEIYFIITTYSEFRKYLKEKRLEKQND